MSDRDGWFDGRGLDLLRENFLDDHEGWKKYIEDSPVSYTHLTLPTKA